MQCCTPLLRGSDDIRSTTDRLAPQESETETVSTTLQHPGAHTLTHTRPFARVETGTHTYTRGTNLSTGHVRHHLIWSSVTINHIRTRK